MRMEPPPLAPDQFVFPAKPAMPLGAQPPVDQALIPPSPPVPALPIANVGVFTVGFDADPALKMP